MLASSLQCYGIDEDSRSSGSAKLFIHCFEVYKAADYRVQKVLFESYILTMNMQLRRQGASEELSDITSVSQIVRSVWLISPNARELF